MKQKRRRRAKVHWCTTLDEKPPCSQWGETENLRNMAAPCCNASSLLRAALSLPLVIISRSKHQPCIVFGAKRKKCVFVSVQGVHLCAGVYVHVLFLRVWTRVYVSASTASILNSFGGDCASLDVMNIRERIHLRGIQFHRCDSKTDSTLWLQTRTEKKTECGEGKDTEPQT